MLFNFTTSSRSVDSIQYAAEIGRLDFISALLAVIALVLVLAAIPTFVYLRYRAEKVAKESVDSYMEEIKGDIEKEAINRMERMLPKLAEDYVLLLAENKVDENQADNIALAQEGDE